MSHNFEEIEAGLSALLDGARDVFSQEETAMVMEYMDVGEYLLALETFVGIVVEGRKKISRGLPDEVMRVASLMRTDSQFVRRIMDVVDT